MGEHGINGIGTLGIERRTRTIGFSDLNTE